MCGMIQDWVKTCSYKAENAATEIKMIHHAFKLTDKIGRMWCRLMHESVSWPIHGHYHCWTCMRQYQVGWTEAPQNTPVVTIRADVGRSPGQLQRVA